MFKITNLINKPIENKKGNAQYILDIYMNAPLDWGTNFELLANIDYGMLSATHIRLSSDLGVV